MHPATIEVMHEQVRAIYRAATGAELFEAGTDAAASEQAPPADSEIERRFAELDALARQNKLLAECVPPFSFTPLADVIDNGSDLLVEIAVPGVAHDDVEIEMQDHLLIVSGVRRGERVSRDRTYLHAEIPRGPFSRTIALPFAVEPSPQLDVRGGVISIRLHKR